MSKKQNHLAASNSSLPWVITAAVVIGIVGAFFLGYSLTSNNPRDSSTNDQTSTNGGTPDGNAHINGPCQDDSCSGGQRSIFETTPVTGKVTAISSDSITLQPLDGSNPKTYAITSETKEYIHNDETDMMTRTDYKSGDVKIGDQVGIVASSKDSNKAAIILLNSQVENHTGDGN